jgi:cytochrome P450
MKLLLLKRSFKFKTKIYFRPIVGYQPLFRQGETEGDSHAFFYKIMRENPDVKIIITNFLATPLLFICDPDLTKDFIMNQEDNYDKLLKTPISKRYLLGLSMIANRKEKWKQQRRCLGTSFSYEKLESSLPLIQETIEEKLSDLDNRLVDDKPVKIVEEMGLITGEVVVRFFFNQDFSQLLINGKKIDRELEWIISSNSIEERKPKNLLKTFLIPKLYFSLNPLVLSQKQKEIVGRAEKFNKEIHSVIQKKKIY